MEPKFSSPEVNAPTPEQSTDSLPTRPSLENAPELPAVSVEHGEHNPERAAEYAAQAQAGMAATQVVPILPTPTPLPQTDASQALPADDLPVTAKDEDLIEKEWVDKAKQIISQTRDDPARREKEVGRLQADYLKKRYGKELGVSPE